MKCLQFNSDIDQVKLYLYVSHGLSTFGERAWDFMTGLILLKIDMTSLRLVAALGLSEAIAGLILGPIIGHYIDRSYDRYKVACQFYLLQNLGILCACIMAVLGLNTWQNLKLFFAIGMIGFSVCGRLGMSGATISVAREWTKALFFDDPQGLAKLNSGMMAIDLTNLLVAPILSGALMNFLGSSAGAIFLGVYNAVVWIIEVLALKFAISIMPNLQYKQQQNIQQSNNNGDKMIIEMQDMHINKKDGSSSQLEFSDEYSTLIQNKSDQISSVNIDSQDSITTNNFSQQQQQQSIQQQQQQQNNIQEEFDNQVDQPPQISDKNIYSNNNINNNQNNIQIYANLSHPEIPVLDDENDIDELHDQIPLFDKNTQKQSQQNGNNNNNIIKKGKFSQFSVIIYFSQFVWPAGFSLAMLYLTVMSFGILMTSYLKYRGIEEFPLSLWRGGGAISGVISTFSFPRLHKIWGLKITALVGIVSQVSSLWIGLLMDSFINLSSDKRLNFLVLGLVFSRWGLYTFDAGVMQMLQDWVPNEQLGRVNGVQNGLQKGFELGSFLMTMVLADTNKFHFLMWGSVSMVSCAMIIYIVWILRALIKN